MPGKKFKQRIEEFANDILPVRKKPKHINEQPVSTNYNPYPGGPMTEQQYNEFGFKNKDVNRIYNQESIKVNKKGMPYNESFMAKIKNQKIKA
jgi:hypothetical protein